MRRHAALLAAAVGLAACSSAPEPPSPAPEVATETLGFLTDGTSPAPTVSVEVPDGFHNSEQDDDVTPEGLGWYVVSDDQLEFLGFYAMAQIYPDACHVSERDRVTPGPSVQDLADALVGQAAVQVGKPSPVTLGGYDGLYLEVTGPADISGCTKQGLSPTRLIYGDGQVDRLWILDVDGQRLVVDASYSGARSSATAVGELEAMVQSLHLG